MAKNRTSNVIAIVSKSLPADVAAKYTMTSNHTAGEYYFNGHRILLNEISIKEADALVESGFPYLQLKESEDSSV